MPWIENQIEFTHRMNCPHVIDSRGHLLFENGGLSIGETRHSSPEDLDRQELLNRKAEYYRVLLGQEEEKFQQIKTYITTQAEYHEMGAGPAPEPGATAALKKQRSRVFQVREKLRTIESELAQLDETALHRKFEENSRRAQQTAASRVMDEVSRIEI